MRGLHPFRFRVGTIAAWPFCRAGRRKILCVSLMNLNATVTGQCIFRAGGEFADYSYRDRSSLRFGLRHISAERLRYQIKLNRLGNYNADVPGECSRSVFLAAKSWKFRRKRNLRSANPGNSVELIAGKCQRMFTTAVLVVKRATHMRPARATQVAKRSLRSAGIPATP